MVTKKNVKLLEVFKKKMSLCWLRLFFTCGMDCYFLNVCPRLLFMLLWTWWQIAWCNLCVKRDSPSGIYVSSFFVKRSALSFICIPGLKKPLDLEKVHFFWEIPRRATNRYAVISTLINHNIIRHRVMAYCLQAPWLFTRNIQIMDLMDEQGKKRPVNKMDKINNDFQTSFKKAPSTEEIVAGGKWRSNNGFPLVPQSVMISFWKEVLIEK